MDITTLLLGFGTVTLLAVTVQAWRMGNEKRDIALLGTFGGLFGAGTLAAAVL